MDKVLLSLGLVQASGELPPEGRAIVVAEGLGFFRAGGVFGWDEWRQLSEETRNCLQEAANQITAEKIAVLAQVLGAKPSKKPVADQASEDEAAVASGISELLKDKMS